MLWLALPLPRLPLDVCVPAIGESEPAAIMETVGRSEYVVSANELAMQMGICVGMKASAATALAAHLRLNQRNLALEQAALQNLAIWAQQFTPTVCLVGSNVLLLEIGRCLAYFGELDSLLARIHAAIKEQGFHFLSGCAPTPLAAHWLALTGKMCAVLHKRSLPAAFSELPVSVLPISAEQQQNLRLLGANSLREVMNLPRRGLTRRFGKTLPQLLDRALGKVADPQLEFVAPALFSRRFDLTWPVESTEPLLFVGRRLLLALAGFLSSRSQGVQQLLFTLHHNNSHKTDLVIGFGQPTRHVDELLAVLRERLERCNLIAPVEAVTLEAKQLHALTATSYKLFSDPTTDGNITLLRARLAARLGESAVRQIAVVEDHRPEYAWTLVSPGSTTPATPAFPSSRCARPAWLLDQPIVIAKSSDDALWYNGDTLTCQGSIERIETGWWDGRRVVRDYRLAIGHSGRRYWVFQERDTGQWFLHGLFD